jgi:ATP-dependent Lhr-like helicase
MPLSSFHPTVRRWFLETLGEPSIPQREGWPSIRAGRHTLIAAPTGSGKTLAAFLWAIDDLLRQGSELPSATRVLYVSPLKALGNDIRKNLDAPLAALRERDPSLPEIRVLVRSGDTPQHERARMGVAPPHILVTTPESLYILLTSESGRRILSTVRTAIVDEIHALVGNKRGSHLSLSLERLEALAGPVQRIGLSATQKPLEAVADFLVGQGRECCAIDAGHLRKLDLDIELPASPLSSVCSHETWEEIYARMTELVLAHRTTLVFVNTRKMAERVSAQLTRLLGENEVTCHHGSLSKERRLEAEFRLKDGKLRALVATASLELGIDIGEVDLVIQTGSTRSIATFIQRVGRSGHGIGRTPKGRLFPLTQDELVEAVALLRAVRKGDLDRLPIPSKPLDILAQQVVAACVPEPWDEEQLFERCRRAHPYRGLERSEFDEVVRQHTEGRRALLHRDGVNRRLLATRRARLVAITSGGAIPDVADYRVVLEPEETFVGTLNEDFAIESNVGDIFQLGNASWRILGVERGVVRVADAQGMPPTLPFWFGEAPGRTAELSREISNVRKHAARARTPDTARSERPESNGVPGSPPGPHDGAEASIEGDAASVAAELEVSREAAQQLLDYVTEGKRVLGCVPTNERVVVERFFDESGGMQLVVHAPFGTRITRAWGLALRKRFCRHFGFELQAAANEEAFVLSLGPQHSFPLQEVFRYLHSNSAREVLIQAILGTPMFMTRWRWNVSRALLLPRMQGGKRVPPPITRMRADDLLVQAFPEVLACPENLPPGELPVPMEHPLVRQTIEDCLHEAMDVEGFLEVLRSIERGAIERIAVDTPEPSAFAKGILNVQPYGFLDNAPLEERRTQAVLTRRSLDPKMADEIGALDPDAVARVRAEAWPDPRTAEEVHEALLWMGYVTEAEAEPWREWTRELEAAGRVVRQGERIFAFEATREAVEVLRGRLEALGPVFLDDPLLLQLEARGQVLRVRLDGREAWCDRRLLSRIQRYTLDRLRQEISPVSAAEFLRFLACWQRVDPEFRLEGPHGLRQVIGQLAGFEAPVAVWERAIFARRVTDYRSEWLDDLTLSGEIAWGRLWGEGTAPVRATPITFVPRADLATWQALAGDSHDAAAPQVGMRTAALPRPSGTGASDEVAVDAERPVFLSGYARAIEDVLNQKGAMFHADLERACRLLPGHFEQGLAELVGHGLLTCDSFRGARQLLRQPSRRGDEVASGGRWSLFRATEAREPDPAFVARQMLARYGVVFRRMLTRERIPVPWRDLVRVYRTQELRGEVRGGRFVAAFSGEQYALPEAVEMLRRVRRRGERSEIRVAAADPLNLAGVLTPDARVSRAAGREVSVV